MQVQSSDKKILGEIEIHALCSDFVRLFLIRDAKILKRHLNPHLNHILRAHCQNEAVQTIHATLIKQNTQIAVRPYKSVLKLMQRAEAVEMATLLETAIFCYVTTTLSDKSEKTAESRAAAKEILAQLEAWDAKSLNQQTEI